MQFYQTAIGAFVYEVSLWGYGLMWLKDDAKGIIIMKDQ